MLCIWWIKRFSITKPIDTHIVMCNTTPLFVLLFAFDLFWNELFFCMVGDFNETWLNIFCQITAIRSDKMQEKTHKHTEIMVQVWQRKNKTLWPLCKPIVFTWFVEYTQSTFENTNENRLGGPESHDECNLTRGSDRERETKKNERTYWF